ncbi:MAG TPA: pirin family protein [Rhodanobacteraceae bacterium]
MSSRSITRRVRGVPTSDGAGVKLTRVIGQPKLDALDPFLLLDEFGSDSAGDYIAGFPDHPHRGFETVTYMLDGRMRHRDNHGNSGLLEPGSVQWMTAGRGIVHSEMPEQEHGRMRGFQLWVNLAAAEKMGEPRYQDIAPDRIPVVEPAPGVKVRVVAGELFGARGPVSGIAIDPVYLDIALAPGARLNVPVPAGHSAFAYLFEGSHVQVGSDSLALRELGVLSGGDGVDLATAAADDAARVLLVAGRPLGESIARYGPFVMNTPEQVVQAMQDYQAGRF